MACWYQTITLNVKNKNGLTNILNCIKDNFKVDKQLIRTKNEKELEILGSEGNTISLIDNDKIIPDVKDLFLNISKNNLNINYSGYALIKNSISDIDEEYFIDYKDCTLLIKCLDVCSKVDLCDYDSFEDLMEDYDCKISESRFERLLDEEDVVYISQEGKVLTENQYYNNKKEYFKINLK